MADRELSGTLYGIQKQAGSEGLFAEKGSARIVAARIGNPRQFASDRALRGLDRIGIWSARERGEVFLTDDDLLRMDEAQVSIALVVVGERAGIFVRESDGSIQAIKSHLEFDVKGPLPGSETRAIVPANVQAAFPAWLPNWIRLEGGPVGTRAMEVTEEIRSLPLRIPPALQPMLQKLATRFSTEQLRWIGAAASILVLAVPIGAVSMLGSRQDVQPIEVSVRQQGPQLLIHWDPALAAAGAKLEIVDEGQHTSLDLAPRSGSATYLFQGTEVEVHLTATTPDGSRRAGSTRFVAPVLTELIGKRVRPVATIEREVQQLEKQVELLRASVNEGASQVANLQKKTRALVEP